MGMSSQLESLRRTVAQESSRFKEIESREDYINIMVETSPDPIAASVLLSSYLISRNKAFTLRFVDPLLVVKEQFKPPSGTTFFLGYTGLQAPKDHPSFEISCYSDPSARNILNPYTFGLNGVLMASTTALTYLFLKELGYVPTELSSLVLGGILSSQASQDPEKLNGLNREVLEDFKKETFELSNSLKIPMAEGLDLSISLSLMLEPFVLGVSGDQKGSSALLQDLAKKKKLSKLSGIIAGNDARVLFDELSRLRSQNGFKEIEEGALFGPVYMDRRHPADSPLRNIYGVALALEACSSMGLYGDIYRLFICRKRELYKQLSETMLEYASKIAALTKQILQNQEYFRETQNALYVFAPPQSNRGLISRTVRALSQSKAFSRKVIIMVTSIDHWSCVVGYTTTKDADTIDLGNTFKAAAERSKGLGYGSSIQATAYVPTSYVESFFDDVDVRLSG